MGKAKSQIPKVPRRSVRGVRYYQIPPLEPGGEEEWFPSVTSVTGSIPKPALIEWSARSARDQAVEVAADLYEDLPSGGPRMSRMGYLATIRARLGREHAHERILAQASGIGGEAHNLIEWTLRKQLGQEVGPEPRLSDAALWAYMAWDDWQQLHRPRVRLIEQNVWSRSLRVAGTMDTFADLTWPNDPVGAVAVPTIIDWKTGKAIYFEAKVQVAAYGHLLIEMGHAEPPLEGAIVRLPKVETDPQFEVCRLSWEEMVYYFERFKAALDLFTASQRERELYEQRRGKGGPVVAEAAV